ncbi:hypothetical protein ACJZ2D_008944 [Fusarium nematophilum]
MTWSLPSQYLECVAPCNVKAMAEIYQQKVLDVNGLTERNHAVSFHSCQVDTMFRFHALLCIIPQLPLTLPSAHAALLHRADHPFKPPGIVFTEPAARSSFEVPPFKETHHDRAELHRTLSVVRRMVEGHGDMVEVSEETLQDLLDQINSLHEQVSEMLPSGSVADRRPSQQTDGQSGSPPGQLPGGSSDAPARQNQPDELPTQPGEAESTGSNHTPGPSDILPGSGVLTKPTSFREPNSPSTTIPPEPASASDNPNTPGQPGAPEQPDNQMDRESSGLPESPTETPSGSLADLPSGATNDQPTRTDQAQLEEQTGAESAQQPEQSLPAQPGDRPGGQSQNPPQDEASADQAGGELNAPSGEESDSEPNRQPGDESNGQSGGRFDETGTPAPSEQLPRQTEIPSGATSSNQPTGTPNDLPDTRPSVRPSTQVLGQPSELPGGAFKEDPDKILNNPLSTATPDTPQDPASDESLKPSQTTGVGCSAQDEVSGLSIIRRDTDCTPGDRSNANMATPESLSIRSLPLSSEIELDSQATSTLIETRISQQATTRLVMPSQTVSIVDSRPLTTPTTPSAPLPFPMAASSTSKHSTATRRPQSLRTLVFTSVLTRSTTVTARTTYTEFFHIGPPTRSPAISGMIFMEETDEASTEDGSSRVSRVNDETTIESSSETSHQESASNTAATLLTTSPSSRMPTTNVIWSTWSTAATPAPTLESSARTIILFNTGSANETYRTPPPSGFRTVSKPMSSLVERAQGW